jgi:transposase
MVVHVKKYRPWDPDSYRNLPFSATDRLPEDDLAYFLIDIMPQLDLSKFYAPYEQETRGAPPYEPAMMVCLLLYCYCVGVFSSRKIARACERNLAFLAIVGPDRPDFRTISDFRNLHLDAFEEVFLQVIRLAAELGMVSLGNVSFDGSKFLGNASRPKAMSYGYMKKEEERLKGEIQALLLEAQQTDGSEDATRGASRGDELPEELKRRQERLATIQEAKQRLEERARAEAEAQRKEWEEEEAERLNEGKKPRAAKTFSETPEDKAQINFTDPDQKIMPQGNKGWDYGVNAQAAVDGKNQIILAGFITTATNDKQQGSPLAQATRENLQEAGIEIAKQGHSEAKKIPATADTGYFSEKTVAGMQEAGFDPYIATKRQKHNQGKQTASETAALSGNATAKQKMEAKMATKEAKELYARRKVNVEPVFGQIKAGRGFRRFSMRGKEKMNGEWRLVCLTHNLLKIWRYGSAPSKN